MATTENQIAQGETSNQKFDRLRLMVVDLFHSGRMAEITMRDGSKVTGTIIGESRIFSFGALRSFEIKMHFGSQGAGTLHSQDINEIRPFSGE